MSARKLKEIRKGYRQAGAIYWTKDMEVIIRRIRAWRTIWMGTAILEAIFLLGWILKARGIF